MDNPDQGWLARLRETDVCLVSGADIDGRDSLDGYRSRYYQGIAHEVPIRAVAATVMSVKGQKADLALAAIEVGSYLNNGHEVRPSDVMEHRTPTAYQILIEHFRTAWTPIWRFAAFL
jgi:hypothetical protein